MVKNLEIILAIFSFVFAIFISSFVKIGITFSIFLIFISSVLFLFVRFFVQNDIKNKIILLIIFLLSFSIGIIRYEIKDSKQLDFNLESNIGEQVVLSGVIVDEPKKTDKQVLLTISFKNIFNSSSSLVVFGKGLISTDLYPEFKYGDEIKIYGVLKRPENFTDSFDYISYLSKDNIFYKIDFAKVELLSVGNGNFIKTFLFKFKNSFIANIDKTITAPQSQLLSGILLGSKNSTDEQTTESFRKSGLSHIVALSGYNITIVSEGISKFFSFLPHTVSFIFGVIGIILFVLMSGASSTAVRAGIMALIVILAHVSNRNYRAGRALVFAGFLMVLFNPKILVFDMSFQLSFLATVAIIYVAPILKNKFIFITERFGMRDIVSSTISAQIMVLPLILNKIGLFSLVALPANILVLVFIPATMLLGFMSGIIGFLSLYLSLPFAWVSWLLLSYIIKVSKFFSELPFATLNINWFSSGIMFLSYILITIWIVKNKNEVK